MVSNYCEDCGQGTNNGICSNCQEELYITEYQGEFMDKPPSKEFTEKALAQSIYLNGKP